MALYDRKQKVRTWELVSGGWEYNTPTLRVIVHHYHGMPPETWFLTCYDLRIERKKLKATEDTLAKVEALAMMREHVRNLAAELAK